MSFINSFADKLYKQSTSGWFGQKMNDIVGDDYQKHLLNTTVSGGIPLLGYGMDYQQAEKEGESGWHRVGGNAGRSAAILAAIFGGSALAGGSSGGGSGGAAGVGADGSMGTGSGIGAENGGLALDTGNPIFGGGAGNAGNLAGYGGGASGSSYLDKLMQSGQMPGGGGQQQQQQQPLQAPPQQGPGQFVPYQPPQYAYQNQLQLPLQQKGLLAGYPIQQNGLLN